MKVKSFIFITCILLLLQGACVSPENKGLANPPFKFLELENKTLKKKPAALQAAKNKRDVQSLSSRPRKQKFEIRKSVQEETEGKVSVFRLKSGDTVLINLRSIPEETEVQDIIDENGNITLPLIDKVQASGKTAAELEDLIQKTYVTQKIYKGITVNVVIPSQSFYVRGEVKTPGRFPIDNVGVTLVQAIAIAGGYTDFANAKKVKIIRGRETLTRNLRDLEKNPEKDEDINAGDVIVVPRSIF
ncbi:MAG: hypothetical protein GKR87_06680 [Kiritimatiellae bacterium]|nr:hypothetical protein [Kiritimatiellia bacterium]